MPGTGDVEQPRRDQKYESSSVANSASGTPRSKIGGSSSAGPDSIGLNRKTTKLPDINSHKVRTAINEDDD